MFQSVRNAQHVQARATQSLASLPHPKLRALHLQGLAPPWSPLSARGDWPRDGPDTLLGFVASSGLRVSRTWGACLQAPSSHGLQLRGLPTARKRTVVRALRRPSGVSLGPDTVVTALAARRPS
jgi:hypothetical protein